MNIYIGFSSPHKKKIGSELIKWWTEVPYSHTFIRFESSDPEMPSNVYHAAHGRVHFIEYENFKKENQVYREFALPVENTTRKKVLAKCMRLSFTGYGYCELFKILYVDCHYGLGFGVPDTFNGKGYICSELVGKMLVEYFNYQFKKPLYLLKPNEIHDKLIEMDQVYVTY